MKLDYKCVEYILSEVEKRDYLDVDIVDLVNDEYGEDTIRYHVALMQEAGLIIVCSGFYEELYEQLGGTIKRLTWLGHEMLDALREGYTIKIGYAG